MFIGLLAEDLKSKCWKHSIVTLLCSVLLSWDPIMIKQLHEAWFIHHACMRFMCLHRIFKTQFTIYYNFTMLLQFSPMQ